MTIFNSAYPLLASTVLFGVVVLGGAPGLSVGAFLAFFAAFGLLTRAVIRLGQTSTAVCQAVPAYERARPILDARPEVDAPRMDPGELGGAIEVEESHFGTVRTARSCWTTCRSPVDRASSLPWSVRQAPGSRPSSVCCSGLRRPEPARSCTTDGTLPRSTHERSGADRCRAPERAATLRRHHVQHRWRVYAHGGRCLGSSATCLPGRGDPSTPDGDAHRPQRGGRHTLRRTATAPDDRAGDVHRPRILLFDEATSALDNWTQATVARSLEQLTATRLVIAHRLSTVVNADRIYVLERGRVAESGTYLELMEYGGLFANLARRQLV